MEKQKTVVTGVVNEEESNQQPTTETEKPKEAVEHAAQMEFPFTRATV